ncbi:MAG TPA: ATP-dependent helicase HrpB [Spirochaetota bacterium]|nr:ATP-dependent helicase HrpB [Spirochaetota bacterium]HRS77401.1 ATP-dependent helicase HrpB [Spirochaetota bacterium]HRT74538.1 ATP-dependent helicase HrpB [Spirochaetota bacterium]
MAENEIQSLPIYPHLDDIAGALAREGILLLHAETGAGKTTLVPWRLLSHKAYTGSKTLLLQPRRIAARAAADRIASLLGEKMGQTVGLRTRTETVTGAGVRLEVVTEGVLTRIIQNDQSLEGYGTLIFDEFHERNLQADIALALSWDCRATIRPDIRILFMSATLPAGDIRSVFGDIKLISVPGRTSPVRVLYRPPRSNEKPWEGAARLTAEVRGTAAAEAGDTLVFLPGFREINRTRETIARNYPNIGAEIVTLHGQLPPEEQRRVLNPPARGQSRIILSTNVAETSLTIPGVRSVVDSGLERRVRYLPRTGMDHWDTVPISRASAEQRRGRAGRLGPGVCLRWWSETDRREDFSPPEITESDLAPLVLETALWGASPLGLTWLTPPPRAAVERAGNLLKDLDLIDDNGRITDAGRRAAGMGLHPRLGRMVMCAAERGWLATAAVTAALLEEGDHIGGEDPDFRDRIKAWSAWSRGERSALPEGAARRIDEEARRVLRLAGSEHRTIKAADIDPELAGKLLLLAYPDRAARRTGGGGVSRWLLATGRGARLAGDMGSAEFLAAAELDGGETDARIFLAAPITIGDLESGMAGQPVVEHHIEWEGWVPRSRSLVRLGKLILTEHSDTIPSEKELRQLAQERIIKEGLECLPWSDQAKRLCAKIKFVQKHGGQSKLPDFLPGSLILDLEKWLIPYGNYSGDTLFDKEIVLNALKSRLGWENLRTIDSLAPDQFTLPSGTRTTIDYEFGEIPILAARIQEFFGSTETPKLCGVPLLIHLLSPAGRPIQITRDLDGFWDRAYPEVKKELKGRYPRHYWPDDPRIAEPTSRAKPRKR